MRRRKAAIVSGIAAMMMSLSLAGCGGNSASTSKSEDSKEDGSAEFKSFMVCDTGGVNDQSFNQSAWEGLQEFSDASGAQVGYLESTQASDFATNFDKLADFLNRISAITDVEFIFTISADEADLPQKIFDIAEVC